jgi:hypothetical protein
MSMASELHLTVARKEGISNTQPQRHTALRTAAETLSRRNADQAVCELMNESLARLVQLAYEQDAGGFCNIDRVTGKLLIPLPWGRNGHAKWGVRPMEAVILRQILFDWHYPGPTLLRYDRSRRAWFVNLYEFANHHLAKGWLREYPITVTVYREAHTKRLVEAVAKR